MKYIYNGYASESDVKRAIEEYERSNPDPLRKIVATVGESNLPKSFVAKIKAGKPMTFQELFDIRLNLTGKMKDIRR